jgi:hypothetical protein
MARHVRDLGGHRVEQRASRLIAATLFLLTAVIAVESIRSLIAHEEPDASTVGIVPAASSRLCSPSVATTAPEDDDDDGDHDRADEDDHPVHVVMVSPFARRGIVPNGSYAAPGRGCRTRCRRPRSLLQRRAT